MDPFSALVIAFLVGGYFTRNVVQDLAWKARGEDPPSYRRQMARLKAREAKAAAKAAKGPRQSITDRQEARRFWANAWHDAWEEAHERRARTHEKRAERRRQQWRAEDEQQERHEKEQERRQEAIKARSAMPHCEHCGNRCPEEDLSMATPQNAPSGLWITRPTRICPTCLNRFNGSQRPDAPDGGANDELHTVCGRCFRSVPASKTRDVEIDGVLVRACPTCRSGAATKYDVRPDAPDAEPVGDTASDAAGDTPTNTLDPHGDVVVPVDFRKTDNEGDPVSNGNGATANAGSGAPVGEVAGLRSAIRYCEQMAAACTEGMQTAEQTGVVTTNLAASSLRGVASAEQAASGLRGGGTTGPSLVLLGEAMDQLRATQGSFTTASESMTQGRGGYEGAKAKFEAAAAELRKQLAVADQYQANQDAGEKSFLLRD